jgi:hypothetical protein
VIPAILSCVFVIYLYHSLNTDSSQPSSPTTFDKQDPVSYLIERVAGLQARLDALLADRQKEDGE